LEEERALEWKQEIIIKILATQKGEDLGFLHGTKFTHAVTHHKQEVDVKHAESNPASVEDTSTWVTWSVQILMPRLTHLRNLESGRHMKKGL